MADNYLEKKMEDYNRMRPAPAKIRRSLPPSKQGLLVETGELRILVSDIDAVWGRSLVDAFRESGCKVAFISADSRKGTKTAQATGSLFYPAHNTNESVLQALDYLASHWGGIDAVILTPVDSTLELPERITKIVIGTEGVIPQDCSATYINIYDESVDMAALGRFCVFLCSDSGKGLRGQSFRMAGA